MLELNDALDLVQQISISKRKESEDFLQTLREWALVEEFYAKGMERISSHKGFNPRVCEYFLNLKTYTTALSTRSKDLSDKLNGYIIIHYKELLTTQSHEVKSSYLEGKKILEYMKKKNLVNDSNNKYINICTECEQIAFDLDKETSNVKKEKILQKLLTMNKDVEEHFESYTNALKAYNSSIEGYEVLIAKVINAYNFFEEKRCKGFEESLKVLHESLESSFAGFKLEEPYEKLRIKPFEFTSEEFLIKDLLIEYYQGAHPLFQGSPSPNFHYSLLESSGVAKGTKTAVEELYRSEIGEIITKAWLGTDLDSEDYIKLNIRLKDPIGRKAWSWCMNLRRTQGIFKLNDKGYTKVGELMLAALNECERTKDTYIAKNCIILSQTFYKEVDSAKVYLQNCIISHSIWKNMEFWENAVNSAIDEELKKQPNEDWGNKDELSNLHEKNLVFCQLVSFGHIMISFQLSAEAAKELVNKYATIYDFSLDERENIMLAVNDSLETVKEWEV